MTVRLLEGRAVCPKEVPEGTPLRYTALLRKVTEAEADAPLLPADLLSLTCTIFSLDNPGHPIVNSVNQVNILNAGRGTLDGTGRLVLLLEDADATVLDQSLEIERHCVRIVGVYNTSPTRTSKRELEVRVRNLALTP
ncbi:MAG TPA: hypothetical protein VKN16_21425 [Methylomirabilota bacterium]|jgi:hypothetical protein|nr:hypothetical protein [Methylomirabilota bacterium]